MVVITIVVVVNEAMLLRRIKIRWKRKKWENFVGVKKTLTCITNEESKRLPDHPYMTVLPTTMENRTPS